jgi:retinol dehydrogenase-12
MNNAGIMAVPPQLSADGYEIQFATNYLGHALLTKLLLPTMLKTAAEPGSDVRIVTLSSAAHLTAPEEGIRFESLRSPDIPGTALLRYRRSKLINILYSKELAKRYPGIKAIAVHPGIAQTGLDATMRKSFLLARILTPFFALAFAVPIEKATLNQLWAATSRQVQSGEYYNPVGKNSMGSQLSRDMALAGRLWKWTEEELVKWQ